MPTIFAYIKGLNMRYMYNKEFLSDGKIKRKVARLVHDAPQLKGKVSPLDCSESRCNRKSVERGSPVSLAMHHPTSFSNDKDFGPIATMVSMESGENQ